MAEKDIKVSIILPIYGKWNMVMSRLGEFRTYLPLGCEIIIIDDCSPEAEKAKIHNGVAFWQKSKIAFHPIQYIENKENVGFGASLNIGAERAKGDILVFYSSDVITSGNFIDPLLDIFWRADDEPVLVGHRLIYWAAGWNEFNSRIVPYLEGYFISCKREVFDELGGWDTRYGKYDYEDVDLSMAAQILGYNLVEFKTPFIKHLGAGTIGYSDDRMKHTEQNRLIFADKWREELEL